MLKKTLLLVVALAAAVNAWAAPVDVATAKATAQQYLVNKVYAGKYMAPAATEPVLIMTEMGKVNKETPVFYIFNTETTYLIVAGDDRAEEVLAYGDKPLNLDRIPDGLKDILACYQEELDWLISNPDVKVEKPAGNQLRATGTYGPLLTANWDQTAPYWNQCKFTYNGTSYQCYTGCPATSASMVLYFWKYPTAQVNAIPSYTAELDLSYYNSVSNYTYPALSATTFDWANMKDSYSSYNTAQGTAVATLMRYVGQAEHMMYGTESAGGSGIYTTDTQNIVDMFTLFGYDSSTCRVANKSSYSSDNWAALIQNEVAEGRPMVYTAVSSNGGGHAFNVDGYNSSTNKYHVNFGWSGDGNNWYSMNSFSYSGYTFNQGQQAVIGIKPPASYFGPSITASQSALNMTANVGGTATATFTVTGASLTGNVNVSVSGTGFSVSPTTISTTDATNGKTVTVTYAPTTAGTHNGTITLSSTGADNVTVALTGTAKYALDAPTLDNASNIDETSFTASWTHEAPVDVTYTLSLVRNGSNVSGYPKTGITTKSFDVTGLESGNTYQFKVKAVPVNTNLATESAWSTTKSVKLSASTTPKITATPTEITFGNVQAGQTTTQTFNVTGANLTGNITATLTDQDGVYSLDATTITTAQASTGKTITVTFAPNGRKQFNGTITLKSQGAADVTIALTGNGTFIDPVMLPADESHIDINKFRADWTDETPAANVASYTLVVNYVAPEPEVQLLHSLLGTDFTGSATGYYEITLPAPWGGTNVRGGLNSIIYFRNNYNNDGSYGNITYTIPEGYQNKTFTMKITTANTNDGSGNLTVATPQTSAVGHNFSKNETFAWVVTASSGEKITITTTDNQYSPDIAKIEVYSGDATGAKANESGDTETRTVTGITAKNYTVTDLVEGGTFLYKVKAVYTDGTESEWSNEEEVTLIENQNPGMAGDANGDGTVDVNDVTTVISYILGKNPNPFNYDNANVNGDEEVNVNDVTLIISIILGTN
ncbi:MAG: C10 family peptidase [Muribaculaceae bacterium]|nr:C10 family peptidase [Muribaculaceae bacterium]